MRDMCARGPNDVNIFFPELNNDSNNDDTYNVFGSYKRVIKVHQSLTEHNI
jgi:hypothetical protein